MYTQAGGRIAGTTLSARPEAAGPRGGEQPAADAESAARLGLAAGGAQGEAGARPARPRGEAHAASRPRQIRLHRLRRWVLEDEQRSNNICIAEYRTKQSAAEATNRLVKAGKCALHTSLPYDCWSEVRRSKQV